MDNRTEGEKDDAEDSQRMGKEEEDRRETIRKHHNEEGGQVWKRVKRDMDDTTKIKWEILGNTEMKIHKRDEDLGTRTHDREGTRRKQRSKGSAKR